MKTMLLMLALAVAPVLAEDAQKLVTLKYVDPVAAGSLLQHFGVNVRADRQLKVIALSGPKSAVETAEAALKQLDVPAAAPRDFDLTVYLVSGTDADPSDGSTLPQEVQSTVATLKQTFPYKKYELLDALSLRSRAGSSANTTGQIAGNRLTQFGVRSVSLENDANSIRIEGLHLGIRQMTTLDGKTQYLDVNGINTDVVDVKEGQKLVVGRASLGVNRAVFLILIARVAQ